MGAIMSTTTKSEMAHVTEKATLITTFIQPQQVIQYFVFC